MTEDNKIVLEVKEPEFERVEDDLGSLDRDLGIYDNEDERPDTSDEEEDCEYCDERAILSKHECSGQISDLPVQRCKRSFRRGMAHIPGPRRRPKYELPVRVPTAEIVNAEEEIDVDAATAESESVSDDALTIDPGHEATNADDGKRVDDQSSFEPPQPGGLQKPMTFGSVDSD